jgi:hypothetical protein
MPNYVTLNKERVLSFSNTTNKMQRYTITFILLSMLYMFQAGIVKLAAGSRKA